MDHDQHRASEERGLDAANIREYEALATAPELSPEERAHRKSWPEADWYCRDAIDVMTRTLGRHLEGVAVSWRRVREEVRIPEVYIKVSGERWLKFSYDTSPSWACLTDVPACSACDCTSDQTSALGALKGQRVVGLEWYAPGRFLGMRWQMERGGSVDLVHMACEMWDWDLHLRVPGCWVLDVGAHLRHRGGHFTRPTPLMCLVGSLPVRKGRTERWEGTDHFKGEEPWYRWKLSTGPV